MKSIILIVFLSLGFNCLSNAQNITGSWEGLMGDEYLKINISQHNYELCGYTYDVAIDDRKSHCKAYFEGFYDNVTKVWTITGTEFIENSGDHVFMTIKMWKVEKAQNNILRAIVSRNDLLNEFMDMGSRDYFFLRKVASTPTLLPGNTPACLKKKQTPVQKKNVPKPKTNLINKKGTSLIKKDSLIKPDINFQSNNNPIKQTIKHSNVDSNKVEIESFDEMKSRKNNTVTILNVATKYLEIKIYDNGIIDNDTVSVFYDGKLICNKQKLTSNPITLKIQIDDTTKIHELVMFAENLGSIPPNTALIIVTAGEKRYELHSSANLKENAVLQINYNPPKIE